MQHFVLKGMINRKRQDFITSVALTRPTQQLWWLVADGAKRRCGHVRLCRVQQPGHS